MENKGVIGIIIATFVVLIGGIFILSKNPSSSENPTVMADVTGVEVAPQMYDLGNVEYKGGNVSKEFKIKNTTGETLKIKKIATSCMCTTAKVKVGDKESKFYGMEMSGDKNPPINYEIAPGQEASVTFEFDPAAHGPAGVGPVDRSIWLTFSDPGGVKELKFKGVVVN